jgi:hypothetical protein
MKTMALMALAASFVAAPAMAQIYSGDTTGGPTWNRPLALLPPPPSGVGTAVPYEVVPLVVDADGTYSFLMERTGAFWDTYLFLYEGAFDPTDQFTGRIAANDDCGAFDRSCFDIGLLTGVSYFAVATGFGNSDFGTYTLTVRGPGTVTFFPDDGGGGVIPEPATWAMLIAGFGLVGASLRRRRRSTVSA